MRALPRGILRIAGPLACLALLLYAIVSLSRPQYAYVLSFSYSGETQRALQAGIRLDDGLLTVPVIALAEDKSVHAVALPTRTIRGLRLFVGEARAGTIRSLQIATVRGDPSLAALSDERNVYRKIDLNVGLTTEGLRVDHTDAGALTFESLPGASNSFLQFDLAPITLLRDMQVAWAERAVIALVVAAALVWLYGRVRLRVSTQIADRLHSRPATAASAALWFAAAFALYFVYAGRIDSFGWNSI